MNKKIKSKRQAGNEFQDWIEKWIKKGIPIAEVHNQKTVSQLIKVRDKKTGQLKDIWVSKRNDILGCIDLIVMIPNKAPCFIQATLDTGVTKRAKELAKVPWDFRYCIVQLWMKKKPGEIHIKQFDGDELKDIARIIRGKYYVQSSEPI